MPCLSPGCLNHVPITNLPAKRALVTVAAAMLANAVEFAYDQVIIVAGTQWKTLMS
jgi:hypothetical protein